MSYNGLPRRPPSPRTRGPRPGPPPRSRRPLTPPRLPPRSPPRERDYYRDDRRHDGLPIRDSYIPPPREYDDHRHGAWERERDYDRRYPPPPPPEDWHMDRREYRREPDRWLPGDGHRSRSPPPRIIDHDYRSRPRSPPPRRGSDRGYSPVPRAYRPYPDPGYPPPSSSYARAPSPPSRGDYTRRRTPPPLPLPPPRPRGRQSPSPLPPRRMSNFKSKESDAGYPPRSKQKASTPPPLPSPPSSLPAPVRIMTKNEDEEMVDDFKPEVKPMTPRQIITQSPSIILCTSPPSQPQLQSQPDPDTSRKPSPTPPARDPTPPPPIVASPEVKLELDPKPSTSTSTQLPPSSPVRKRSRSTSRPPPSQPLPPSKKTPTGPRKSNPVIPPSSTSTGPAPKRSSVPVNTATAANTIALPLKPESVGKAESTAVTPAPRKSLEVEAARTTSPVVPRKPSLTPDLDAEIARLRASRLALAVAHVPLQSTLRRAKFEYSMALLDLQHAEDRRKVAERQRGNLERGLKVGAWVSLVREGIIEGGGDDSDEEEKGKINGVH